VHTVLEAGGEEVTEHDEVGHVVASGHLGFDGLWITEEAQYDLLGRRVAETRPGIGGPATDKTTLRYDSLDRLIARELPDGSQIVQTHTPFRTSTWDAKMNRSYVERDVDGRVIKSVQVLENKEIATTFTYGDFHQLAYVTDAAQNTTQILYD